MLTHERTTTLLRRIITQNAQLDPDGVFACIPAGTKYCDGYRNVTKAQFENAINYTASLLRQNLSATANFETLAYIGPGDLRYSIIVVAGMKAGVKVFLPSPRNSIEAHVSLLQKLQCTKLVVTSPQAPCVSPILGLLQLQTLTLPPLDELLELANVTEYPFEKSFADTRSDPAFVLHTSGSTGIPKPLVFTNDFISRVFAASCLPPPAGYVDINRYVAAGKFFITLPSFHIAGLAYSLLIAAYHGSIPVYPLPGPPPMTESFISAISNASVDWAFIPPVVIDELGKRPDLLDAVAMRLKYLFFTGGSVPKASGDVVARRVPIWQVMGSSECGSLPLVYEDGVYNNSEDWLHLQVNPTLGYDMRHRLDDLFELVIVRNTETEHFQPVFTHFPDATEYETRDLFKPHPTKAGVRSYQSRIDDVIVFLNGEKTNPVTFEEAVMCHPEVRAALVVGAQRFEAALLVETNAEVQPESENAAALIERIWPTVVRANNEAPAHARVSKTMVHLCHPQKPMLRAGKGTVQRNATLALYAEEIEKLYRQSDKVADGDKMPSEHEDVKCAIRDLVSKRLGLDDLDFFQLGLDSLGVLQLQRALKSRFPGLAIAPSTVYGNPSVRALSQALMTAERSEERARAVSVNKNEATEVLIKVLDEYKKEIDTISPILRLDNDFAKPESAVVLLTGSTGALGSYVLDRLLETGVGHVYCLNRTSDAQQRQVRNHTVRQLRIDLPASHVTFLAGDLTKRNFGFLESTYKALLSTVTHVVHNAWPVNFNLPLLGFRGSLSGVVSLIRFVAHSRWNSRIQLFSSISSVSSYNGTMVPEAVIPELTTSANMGYGQSKYLAERLLDYASKTLHIHSSSVRIGQISGAARTASGWNKQEWLPSLVRASAHMGSLPETLGDPSVADEAVNWIPIDQMAAILVELASDATLDQHHSQDSSIFHIAHPHPTPWSAVLRLIRATIETINPTRPVDIVPYADWLAKLRVTSAGAQNTRASSDDQMEHLTSAFSLMEFYESLQVQRAGGLRVSLSMEKTLKCSESMRLLEPLKDEWVVGWVRDWLTCQA